VPADCYIQVVRKIFYPYTFENSFHFLAMLDIIKENYVKWLIYSVVVLLRHQICMSPLKICIFRYLLIVICTLYWNLLQDIAMSLAGQTQIWFIVLYWADNIVSTYAIYLILVSEEMWKIITEHSQMVHSCTSSLNILVWHDSFLLQHSFLRIIAEHDSICCTDKIEHCKNKNLFNCLCSQ